MSTRSPTIYELGLPELKTMNPSSCYVGVSTIKTTPRMKGLFAKRNIPRNRIIGEYKGSKVIGAQEASDSAYTFHTTRGSIDASTNHCPMRFINHQPGVLSNVMAREMDMNGRIYIITKRRVKAKSEFFLDYGGGYAWPAPPIVLKDE
jgi:hypothetical protein